MTAHNTNPEGPEKDTVLGQLGKAGSALGELGAQVVKKVRADLNDDDTLDKLKSETRSSFKEADSREDYVEAGKGLAKEASSLLKNVAGSLKAAVVEAKDSEEAASTKSAFASVVESSRDKLDDTVDKVRAKKVEAEAAPADKTESTNEGGTDIIDGEVIPNPEGPAEPRV